MKEKTPKTSSKPINQDTERIKPLFLPCFLLVTGIISLLGIDLLDPALLESANWKQNTILSLLILFGLMPSYVRNRKEAWMIMGYTVGFFMFGGSNLVGTVTIIMLVIKLFLPVFILFQTFRLWDSWQLRKKWLYLFPVISLLSVILLFPIEDKNIVQSGWTALTEWSWKNYRSDGYYHIYLGMIGMITGITEFLIVKPVIFKDDE
jgi:hypothetical protein